MSNIVVYKLKELVAKQLKGFWGNELKEGKCGIKVIKTNNMTYRGVIDYSDVCERDIDTKDAEKNFLSAGDLLVEKSGGTKTHSVGYVNYFDGPEKTHLCNNFILAFRPNPELIDPKYLFYQLKHMYETGSLDDCYNKTTGIQNLKIGVYFNKEILVPTLQEQKRIVDVLDSISNFIATCSMQVSIYTELIKSRFVELFETLDLFEQRSEWQEIKSVSDIFTGTTPSTKDGSNWDGDILWVTPAEINDDTFYVSNTVRKITEKGRKSKSLDLMPKGTVLLSTRAPIGKVGIASKPMTCNQGFKNFKCHSLVNPIFLYVLLKNNTDYLNSLGSGTTFLEVSKSKIEKMKIPVPPVKIQNEYASFVENVEKVKTNLREKIKYFDELLNKKMDDYFVSCRED